MFKLPTKFKVTGSGLPPLDCDTAGVYEMTVVANGAKQRLRVIASNGLGWEHVSVSRQDRCPTWAEMCAVKAFFWDKEDTVVQFHPPESEYVNVHPNCLHLWRPANFQIQTPPNYLV